MSVVAEYDRFCESIHDEPGPQHPDAIDDTFDATHAAIAASPTTRLTPAVSYEADVEVVDLSPRTLDRETARAQLIELFYASLPEAEIGRAVRLLEEVMP